MNCSECDGRMRCVFTNPIGKRLRFRHYKCPACNERLDTVEMPIEVFHDREKHGAVNDRIGQGKAKHMQFSRPKRGPSGG